MEHLGKALAADETDGHHLRAPGVASVHTRAAITWLAIFPLVTAGISLLAAVAPDWPPVLRALVLTLFVVPAAVYLIVPRLLLLTSKIVAARARRARSRAARAAASQ
jgi:antibiotic biosynthesis monooxygenase (ABM) superfamily enzyme